MRTDLRDFFPNIRSREAVLSEIHEKPFLQETFSSWLPDEQERFLDYCTGVRGMKILYDPYFKEIFNPEYVPERLEALLSLILKKKVRIRQILPNDSVRLADEGSLLITDIVVEFADGSIANVEVQKIGYLFPGERIACYVSDLMLRQYRRIRNRQKKKFSYKDIHEVYTIIFYESSPSEFRDFPDIYLHHGRTIFDSGLSFPIPFQFYMIPLDIFRKSFYNNGIQNQLEAWLAFLSLDQPEHIAQLISQYPEFRPLYQHLYDICRNNVERMVGMFSKELQLMDRNTTRLMIDELSAQVEEFRTAYKEKEAECRKKDAECKKKDAAFHKITEAYTQKEEECKEKDDIIASLKKQLQNLKASDK